MHGQQFQLWNVQIHSILQISYEVNQIKLRMCVSQLVAPIGLIVHEIASTVGVCIDNKAPSTSLIGLNRGALGFKFVAAITTHDASALHSLCIQLQ